MLSSVIPKNILPRRIVGTGVGWLRGGATWGRPSLSVTLSSVIPKSTLPRRIVGTGVGRLWGVAPCGRPSTCIAGIFILLYLALSVISCALPGQAQSPPPDPRLKLFHIGSTRILTLDSQAEVDGTILNTDTYKYPFDVSIVATFYDLQGNVIGSATGTAEDVWPGTTRPFTLLGQVDSAKYSRMTVVPVSLRERRIERNLPTPPPVIP